MKKAVIILHGIMGSQLFAAEDIREEGKLKFVKNDRLWIYSPLMDGCFKVTWNLHKSFLPSIDNLLDEDDKIEALACDKFGNSINPVTTSGIDDKQYGDRGMDGEYGATNLYTDIVVRLKNLFGDDSVKFFNYDWRKGTELAVSDLRNDIDNMAENYDTVYIVAHSMGGLVGLEYARTSEHGNKIRLITLGTPFWGAPMAIHVMKTGKALPLNYGMNGLLKVVRNIRACYDLLPTEAYYEKILNSNVLLMPEHNYNDALALQAMRFHNNLNCIKVFNEMEYSCAVVGYGEYTMTDLPDHENGIGHYSLEGDGTVPVASATMGGLLSGDKLVFVKETHGRLVSNHNVLELIINRINNWHR